MESFGHRWAVAHVALVALVAAGVAAATSGVAPRLLWVAVAGIAALLVMLIAAGCATHAVLTRRWGWVAGLILGWPVVVPVYLWMRIRPAREASPR